MRHSTEDALREQDEGTPRSDSSSAGLTRGFTSSAVSLGQTESVAFPKHDCVGVGFVFKFYLAGSEPLPTRENVNDTPKND